jgi:hypothetical protein
LGACASNSGQGENTNSQEQKTASSTDWDAVGQAIGKEG